MVNAERASEGNVGMGCCYRSNPSSSLVIVASRILPDHLSVHM